MTLSDVTTVTARYRGLSLTGLVEDFHPGCVSGPADDWEQPSGGYCIELTEVEVDATAEELLAEWFEGAWHLLRHARFGEAAEEARHAGPVNRGITDATRATGVAAFFALVRDHTAVGANGPVSKEAGALFVAWVRAVYAGDLCEAIEEEAERS